MDIGIRAIDPLVMFREIQSLRSSRVLLATLTTTLAENTAAVEKFVGPNDHTLEYTMI